MWNEVLSLKLSMSINFPVVYSENETVRQKDNFGTFVDQSVKIVFFPETVFTNDTWFYERCTIPMGTEDAPFQVPLVTDLH